jgi:hypothetical protein
MKTILTKWDDEQCPLLNGITYSTGTHYPVEGIQSTRAHLPLALRYATPYPLTDEVPLQWAFITPLCEATRERDGFLVKGGEASMGGDGFVALLNERGALLWIGFFDFSNPFLRVAFDSNYIIADNNLQERWYFPVSEPWKIVVESNK